MLDFGGSDAAMTATPPSCHVAATVGGVGSSRDGDSSGEKFAEVDGAAFVGSAGAEYPGLDDTGMGDAGADDTGTGMLRCVLGGPAFVDLPLSKAAAPATTTATTPTLASSGAITRTPRLPTTRETECHMRTRRREGHAGCTARTPKTATARGLRSDHALAGTCASAGSRVRHRGLCGWIGARLRSLAK
jgi:hypothetical protein